MDSLVNFVVTTSNLENLIRLGLCDQHDILNVL